MSTEFRVVEFKPAELPMPDAIHAETVVSQLDLERKDVDLHLRALLGEANPQPRLRNGRFFYEFYPGRWPQGQELLKPVGTDELSQAYRIAGLGRIEGILQGRNRFATDDQAHYVWLANRGKCGYCPRNVHPDYMQVDHIVPFSRGGKTLVENLVCSCKRCNIAKNAEDPMDFMRLAYSENGGYLLELLYRYRKNPASVEPDKVELIFDTMYGNE